MAGARRRTQRTRVALHAAGQSESVGPEPVKQASWTVLYDAECGFCVSVLAGVLIWDRAGRLRPVALQDLEATRLLPGLPPSERMSSWHLITPAGVRHSGGDALAHLLRLLPGGSVPAAPLARSPRLAEWGYRVLADHRSALSRLLPAAVKRKARGRVENASSA